MRSQRKKNNWLKTILIALLIFITGTSLGFAAMYYAYTNLREKPSEVVAAPTATPAAANDDKRINILLLGVDDGDPGNADSPRRSDTMMVASVNTHDGTVRLLSIPRDTRVNIPGHGSDKITHAFFYGGADLSTQTVEQFLHVSIDHYVVIDWKAFIKVVDILGGVDINVAHDMNYEDPYENLSIHLRKGQQHLNGEGAGEYVRFRHDELGDIGRVQRQQEFLKALTDQMMQAGTIVKLPSLISVVRQYVKTDMDTITLIKLANSLAALKAGALHAEMLPGDFATIDGVSYWAPNMDQVRDLVNKQFLSP